MNALVSGDLPAFVLGIEGPSSLAQNADLDRARQTDMLRDFLDAATEMRLLDHFFVTGRYRCPLARAAVCDAAVTGCRKGWDALDALPDEGCRIRRILSDWNFPIGVR